MLNTVTFGEQGGKTRLTIQGRPINATDAERQSFEAGRESIQQGFAGTFDQLADYLAQAG